jgi:hypothetical protein
VIGVPLITATSNPVNLAKFADLIDLTEGAVHGAAAAAGYAIPIPSTATDAWEYIRGVVRDGAGYEALKMIPGGGVSAAEFRAAFNRAMDEIRSGKQPILSSKDTGETGRGLPRGGGVATPVLTWDWTP